VQLILKLEKEQPFQVTVISNQVLYLQIRAEKSEHTIMYRESSVGQIHNKTAN
jgi:hypothetical protein